MIPANQLSPDGRSLVLLSSSTENAVFYQENANSMQIDLSGWSDSIPVVAVNTRARYREIDLGKRPAQVQTLVLPARSDWVLAIGSFQTIRIVDGS